MSSENECILLFRSVIETPGDVTDSGITDDELRGIHFKRLTLL